MRGNERADEVGAMQPHTVLDSMGKEIGFNIALMHLVQTIPFKNRFRV